jgi:hypothetical protein
MVAMSGKFRMSLPAQTLSSASPRVRELLEQAQSYRGFISNHFARMANSPGLLETTLTGYSRFRKESGFTPAGQEVVLLTISREHGCPYCVAAHSYLAGQVPGVPPAVTNAIRDGLPVPDSKLRAPKRLHLHADGEGSAYDGRRGLSARPSVGIFH